MPRKTRYLASLSCGVLAATMTVTPPLAAADPADWPEPGSGPASASVDYVLAQGYAVAINWVNGNSSVPLSRCRVTGYHQPERSAMEPRDSTIVHVDVLCPDDGE